MIPYIKDVMLSRSPRVAKVWREGGGGGEGGVVRYNKTNVTSLRGC